MRKLGPDTRGLGGRMIVNRIIVDHAKKLRDIKSSCSVYLEDRPSGSTGSTSSTGRRKRKVMIKRKLSTDCYEPETYSLRSSLSRNKKKRQSLQVHAQHLERSTLKRKISAMRHSWFSISSFVFNPVQSAN